MNMLTSGSSMEPDFPMALARIQHMTRDELNDLLNDDSKMDDYIRGLDQVKLLCNEKEELMVANKSLAEYNLSQEPILRAKKEQLASKHREAVQLVSTVKALQTQLESKSGKIQPESLYYLLKVEASKAETESDDIVNDYLEKKIESTDEFLDKFVNLRKLMYLRRVKLDKMSDLMKEPKKSATPARKAPPAPPAAATYNPPTFGSPYPPVPSMNGSSNWSAPPNLPYPIKPTMAMPSPNFR